MYRIRKQFKFEGAHILSHAATADCHENIHGHSYIVELFLCSLHLNSDGMILDFGSLSQFKELVAKWDHALLVPIEKANPPEASKALSSICRKLEVTNWNPTAENMAKYLFERARGMYGHYVEKVRVHETATGWAEYGE